MRTTTKNSTYLHNLLRSKISEQGLRDQFNKQYLSTTEAAASLAKSKTVELHDQANYYRRCLNLFSISLVLGFFILSYLLEWQQGFVLSQVLITLTSSIMIGKLIMREPLL
ncbi:hypothetical protein [Sediminitomix flava]|uniref:Uncharacterized protein n=1 Tax=Sediminitomix flava TaxID=379075 RepID=A0A315Z7H6_SEDFL|nr:hypothetical protein [Sediminitomix flava]PWJ40807.1 hypothetical protein BC781_10466 [Sediminitomix flava]